YRLCGIIYYADYHFVCRVIDQSGEQASYYGNIVNLNMKKLQTVGDYTIYLLIYTKLISRDGS
ncbi:hypothetical protein LXA43DRAFT_903373, partial [Ganoderma leucocontextum]